MGDPCDLTLAGSTSGLSRGRLEEPDHSSSNWYFTRDDIEKNSPSRKDGIDLKKEAYFRKSYCTFLQDLGMRLKVPQITIATAIVFSHRFFLRQSHHKNDRYMIATVCMFLAGKVEETPKPLRDVIFLSYEIRYKKDPAAVQRIKQKQVYEEQKELILLGERLVLATLCFDLNIHHPYKPLVAAIKKFKVAQNSLAQVAWNFVNDGLRTSLGLQFKPHHIAAGAIFLAAKFLKVKLPSEGEKVWWQEFEVTPRQLEEVSNQMLELYEQNREGPASRSSDPNASADLNNRDKGPSLRTSKEATLHANGYSDLPQQSSPSSSVAPPEKASYKLDGMVRREDDIRVPSRHAKQINGLIEPQKELDYGAVPAHHSHSMEPTHFTKSSAREFLKEDLTVTHENDNTLGKQEMNETGTNRGLSKHGEVEKEPKHMGEAWMSGKLKNKLETVPNRKKVKLESQDEGAMSGLEIHQTKDYNPGQPSFKVMQGKDDNEKKGTGESKTWPELEDSGSQEQWAGLDEVNKERVKAALEKQRKSRGEGVDHRFSVIKSELTDEEELLERQLESAVEAEMAKQERKENKNKILNRGEQDGLTLKRERVEEAMAGSKRERDTEDSLQADRRSVKSFERGESIDGEVLPERTEEGELQTSTGQDHTRSPRIDKRSRTITSPVKKRESGNRDRRDALHDSKYRPGHNREHYYHNSHHQHQNRVDTERDQRHYKDRDWQERECKKPRHDHGK